MLFYSNKAVSPKFTVNKADFKSQAISALWFIGPTLLSILVVLTPQVNELVPEGPNKVVLVAVLKFVLDQVTGMLRKFLDGKK